MSGTGLRAGVLGLGIIGSRVAARVQAAGFPLAVWNRTPRAFDGLPPLAAEPAPIEADTPIVASLPAGDDVPGADRALRARPGRAIPATRAALRIDDREIATAPVTSTDKAIDFTVELSAGSHRLAPVFVSDDGHEIGAYYATVTKVP